MRRRGCGDSKEWEELEKELKKLKTDQKKRKMREKAMANEINVFKEI